MNPAYIGIIFIVASQLSFAGMDNMIKALSPDLPVASILFFRNLFTVIIIFPVFIRTGEIKHSFKRIPLHAIRSISGQIGMVLIFTSLHLLPLSDASILRSLTPLFVPILAFFWLKERLSPILIPCFILAIIGSWMLAGMDKPSFSIYSLIPIIAGIFVALAMVAVKRMTKVAKSSEIIFYFSITGVFFALIYGLFTNFIIPTDLRLWCLILVMGLFGSLGQIWLTRANAATEASLLAPFYYLNAVFGAIFSHFFWNETLGLYGWLGATLVILAGLLLTFKSKALQFTISLKNRFLKSMT